jgi:hypothetical protein
LPEETELLVPFVVVELVAPDTVDWALDVVVDKSFPAATPVTVSATARPAPASPRRMAFARRRPRLRISAAPTVLLLSRGPGGPTFRPD